MHNMVFQHWEHETIATAHAEFTWENLKVGKSESGSVGPMLWGLNGTAPGPESL
jgi:hypothetical protein